MVLPSHSELPGLDHGERTAQVCGCRNCELRFVVSKLLNVTGSPDTRRLPGFGNVNFGIYVNVAIRCGIFGAAHKAASSPALPITSSW
jgi:hypothetical protein